MELKHLARLWRGRVKMGRGRFACPVLVTVDDRVSEPVSSNTACREGDYRGNLSDHCLWSKCTSVEAAQYLLWSEEEEADRLLNPKETTLQRTNGNKWATIQSHCPLLSKMQLIWSDELSDTKGVHQQLVRQVVKGNSRTQQHRFYLLQQVPSSTLPMVRRKCCLSGPVIVIWYYYLFLLL